MTSQVASTVSATLLVGGPVPHASRQGRHRQRYGEGGERLLAGCIPVRMSGCSQQPQLVKVCMVTTTSGTGLVFPKGGWEDDESVESAAQRETVEEAGVRGVLEEPLLGVFPFASNKAEVSVDNGTNGTASGNTNGANGGTGPAAAAGGGSGRCKAYIYVMHVAEELPSWPESKDRQRVWCSIPEASRLCKHAWMREALRTWVRRKGWDDMLELCAGGTAAALTAGGAGAAGNGAAGIVAAAAAATSAVTAGTGTGFAVAAGAVVTNGAATAGVAAAGSGLAATAVGVLAADGGVDGVDGGPQSLPLLQAQGPG